MTLPVQPGILEPVPAAARYLTFRVGSAAAVSDALARLAQQPWGSEAVLGVGAQTVALLGKQIDGLRELPALAGPGVSSPSTPGALWLWLRGSDPGELLHRERALSKLLSPAFVLDDACFAFRHGPGNDLSGYEDGTENPSGDDAVAAAAVADGDGLAGSSFVAVQRWVHDLDQWQTFAQDEQDAIIGRRLSDNEELGDAPDSAHVKRTEQESFEPHAFVLRRSMPWAEAGAAGLVFVAFGRSLDAFEVQLRRMLGLDDGISDALFRFTRPVSGCAWWCPPLSAAGRLNLSALLS